MIEDMETGLGLIKSVFLTASEGIIISDKKGKIIAANPKGAALFGYTIEELEQGSIETLIPKSVKIPHHQLREQYFEKPTPRHMGAGRDLEGLKKDGTTFPLEISLSHFEDNANHYAVAFIIDITQRKELENERAKYTLRLQREVEKRTEELNRLNQGLLQEINERKSIERALRESEELYKYLAQNYPNGSINVLDRALNFLITGGVNILDQKAILPEKVIGTNFLKRLPVHKRKLLKAYLDNALDGVASSCEYENVDKVVIMHTVPIVDANGYVDKLLVVEENITEQKRAQGEIKKALSKERELNELKSRFVSMASHEFRTPLATILSSTNLLEQYVVKGKPEKTGKHFDRIKANVDGLTNILNDFLSLEKLESGGISIERTNEDIHSFVKELTEETTPLLKRNQSFLIDSQLEITHFKIDKKVLKNVLLNLISNASKYSDEEKTITIGLKGDEHQLSIEVRDEGIGIPREEKKKMFERFFRAHNAANIQGTGLGLFIVKKYVTLMKGKISLESEESMGTTIKIDIPNE